jgi:hypothetical protein
VTSKALTGAIVRESDRRTRAGADIRTRSGRDVDGDVRTSLGLEAEPNRCGLPERLQALSSGRKT